MQIRRASERGHADHGWLESFHTFSFADYYDAQHMGFRALRVINDDRVAPGRGFGTHPHSDMEIISYVLDGALEHKDSMGTGSVIRPGDVQRMTAGTGVRHSEHNPSPTEPVHFLQIWLLPERRGLQPSYQQRSFPATERQGKLRVVAARDGRDGAITVHQDVVLLAGLLAPGERTSYTLAPARHGWLHVARGVVKLDGEQLSSGDAAAFSAAGKLDLEGVEAAEVLLFDLA
ncbi:MAG: pirin family protein [Deltaproteobacteria bacterium]|nr:pirin family protein [Deltaproteobacteria bacterium]